MMERLLSLRVADLMARELLEVSAHDTMQQAATAFAEREVSGAPVVDETGRCVGVLTSGDFSRRESLRSQSNDEQHQLVGGANEPLHIESIDGDLVARFMSAAVQTVAADASLVQAAKIMDAQHIHRLVVIDAKGFPVGMLSSMDVVAAVVNAVDELMAEAKT
jgi:CBS-domain-containing membrane protein